MIFTFLYFLNLFSIGLNDNIVGCGGYVKSGHALNFSRIEVHLVSSEGPLKDKTECAPHNGYYFIPAYEKGSFKIKIVPPAGWSFEPSEVEVKIDGVNDDCSKNIDINFYFQGFTVSGQILSDGSEDGPSNIKIDLIDRKTSALKASTVSNFGGGFFFNNVLQGIYTVAANEERFQFIVSSIDFSITSDNFLIPSAMSIKGYDVTGKVLADSEPVSGVFWLIFSYTHSKVSIDQCDSKAVPSFNLKKNKQFGNYICHVLSDKDGDFHVKSLPVGEYNIIPFYRSEHTRFDISPANYKFTIKHSHIKIEKPFVFSGFSVTGKIVDVVGSTGRGIANAAVFLDDKQVATTDKNGHFTLDNISVGTYRITAKFQDLQFQEITAKCSPNKPELPPIVISKVNVCGNIFISPDFVSRWSLVREVLIDTSIVYSDEAGVFCSFLVPGKHSIKVLTKPSEKNSGLEFVTAEQTVEVATTPVKDISFTQLLLSLKGTVACLEKCEGLEITAKYVSMMPEQYSTNAIVDKKPSSAAFVFEEMLPGEYHVAISGYSWCWEDSVIKSTLSKISTSVDFVQSGFLLNVTSTHKKVSVYVAQGSYNASFPLNVGLTKYCLRKPGQYTLTTHSCYKFESDSYTYDTAKPSPISLSPVKFLVKGIVKTPPASDLKVTLVANNEVNPIELIQTDSDKKLSHYSFSYWAIENEVLNFNVKSEEVRFAESQITYSVDGTACYETPVIEFIGEEGLFISGLFQPPVEGVSLEITERESNEVVAKLVSDSKGSYRAGPLNPNLLYNVAAEKEGYQVMTDTGNFGSFKIYKLSEILVTVKRKSDHELMPGVLISISSDSSFRSNNLTDANGQLRLIGVGPGQYFLKPLRKEYKFEPSSKMIDLKEGRTFSLEIEAIRVAYSCFGSVSALNREPEGGISFEAKGVGKCDAYHEEGTSTNSGQIVILGLQRNCQYIVRMKQGESNKHFETTIPKQKLISIDNEGNVDEAHFFVLRRDTRFELSGRVITDEKFLSTLSVIIYKDGELDAPVEVVHLSRSPLFFLSNLEKDESNYQLKLKSSLSQTLYTYTTPHVDFSTNHSSGLHLSLKFDPKLRNADHEISQATLFTPVIAIGIMAFVYYYAEIQNFVQENVFGNTEAIKKKKKNPRKA